MKRDWPYEAMSVLGQRLNVAAGVNSELAGCSFTIVFDRAFSGLLAGALLPSFAILSSG